MCTLAPLEYSLPRLSLGYFVALLIAAGCAPSGSSTPAASHASETADGSGASRPPVTGTSADSGLELDSGILDSGILDSGILDSGIGVTASCPSARESAENKLPPVGDGVIESEAIISAIVHLRAVPGSSAGRSGAERVEQNLQQVQCVFAEFGDDGVQPGARWYEPITDAEAARYPIGRAFSARVRWATLKVVATHPYVEKISLDFGQGHRLDPFVRERAFDCVLPEQESSSQVAVDEPQTPTERIAVVVELSQDHLPTVRECDSGVELCEASIASVWGRVMASTHTLTCVKDWLNAALEGFPAPVAYIAQDEWHDFPVLPPFGQAPLATRAFGVALNWNEIQAASRHPFVKAIWSSSGLTLDELPEGCPPSYTAPNSQPSCDQTSEPFARKVTPDSVALWSSEPTTAFEVLVAVAKNYVACPRPACPGTAKQCPERDNYNAWLASASQASQTCVRHLISELGGISSAESFTLGNGFAATLTWAQIQAVASHPDVISVSPATTSVPAP